MNKDTVKDTVYYISFGVNFILAIAFLVIGIGAVKELMDAFVFTENHNSEIINKYLENEEYGIAAWRCRAIRAGVEIDEEDIDSYMIGEYADLLFQKAIFEETGKTDTAKAFEERLSEIRAEMPEYADTFDKIDLSVENVLWETDKDE